MISSLIANLSLVNSSTERFSQEFKQNHFAGKIIVDLAITYPELLSSQVHLFENTLQHNTSQLSIPSANALYFTIAKLSYYCDRLKHTCLIILRKNLFCGQEVYIIHGILLATHLIHEQVLDEKG